MENDEEILSLKHEVEEKAGSIEKERPELVEPVHNGAIEYQAKPSKDVLELNVKLNDLGKIVSPPVKQVDPVVIQSLLKSSTILDGDTDHAQQLVEWMKDKKFGWQLCYRASEDGWGSADFHRKCDGVGPTVTLVKCGTNVFGGFTDQSWKVTDQNGVTKPSIVSFIFSLRNKDNLPPFKCPITFNQNHEAIRCHPRSGANFGSGNMWIADNANTNQVSYTKLGSIYQPPPGYQPGTPQTESLLAGSYHFTPTKIEVFC